MTPPSTTSDVAYLPCLAAQEAAYWEARRQGMNLNDKQIGDLLRVAAPELQRCWEAERSREPEAVPNPSWCDRFGYYGGPT